MDNPLRKGFRLNEWQVFPLEGSIEGDAGITHLEPKVMEVLVLLASHPGELVERERLIREVWGDHTVSDEPLTRCIALLRRALGDSPRSPKCIQTVPKRGYRLVAEVAAQPHESIAVPSETTAANQRMHPLAARKFIFAVVGLALVALALLIANNTLQDDTPTLDGSIAVLPFANFSPDPDNAFFADGIHDDLLTQLAKIQSLTVISRTSVLEYRDTPKNMREIGQELGVTAILEGGVRRAGDTIRINVDLIDARTDKHLWVETYDLELTADNVFAIQSEMATAIAAALEAELLPSEAARLVEVPTRNRRAYDFYLNGNDYFSRSEEAVFLTLARQMYQRALDEDPEFAIAWAALSHTHSRLYFIGSDRTDARLRLAAHAVERAFELAPGLPEAHFALGQYYYRGFRDYERALQEYEIAASGMPGSFDVVVARAEIQRRLGNWDRALAHWEQAMALDPRNPLPLWQTGLTLLSSRDYLRAESHLVRALELAPDDNRSNLFSVIVSFCGDGDVTRAKAVLEGRWPKWAERTHWLWWKTPLYQRDYAGALAELDEWDSDASLWPQRFAPKASLYGVTYQLAGQPELAQREFQKARSQVVAALEANPEDVRFRIALAEVLAGLGDRDAAVREAREAMRLMPTAKDSLRGPSAQIDAIMRALLPAAAYDLAIAELDAYLAGPGQWSIEGLLPDPRLDPIRDDPRFQALVEKYRRR